MKALQNLIALSAVSLFGVACQSNKTAASDPYNTTGQSYGGQTTNADPYATSSEYDNVYASGGGQSYDNASTYQGGSQGSSQAGGSAYGSDDYYAQDNTPAYNPPSYSSGGSSSAGSYGSSSSGSSSHTVQKGDTLYNISKRYGTTVPALRQANGINGDLIRLGESLVIP